MINEDVHNFVLNLSMISYFLNLFHVVRKVIYLALGCNPSSSSSPWTIFLPKTVSLASKSKHACVKNTPNGLHVLEEESIKEREVAEIVLGGISVNSKECPHEISEVKLSRKLRKRPANLTLVVPEILSELEIEEAANEPSQWESEMEGRDYFMASRRGGRRHDMEDGYDVIRDIMGDSNKAFFGVYDGHGGRAAVDFVAENLGKKIVMALREAEEGKEQSKEAIKKGYMVTDQEFLSQDVGSGACAATVLVENGELYVANVGDCRVVLSRKGIATALTSDQRVDREDERMRMESLGGYVDCQKGVWRVQGSLAVSRAIGDLHLKPLVISEPETRKIEITADCEFLVIASDGLWDKVSNQEAVDMVLRHKSSIESCRKLVETSCSRGNKDDITVMVVDLQNFKMQS